MIKLRNPIGQEEYTGLWNNFDKLRWSARYQKQANLSKSLDGNGQGFFYMDVASFKRAFQNYDVTYYHDNWKRSSFHQEGSGKNWQYPFSIIREQDLFLTFDQLPSRMVPPNCNVENENQFNILLRDSNGKVLEQQPVSSKTGYGVIHQKSLPPGDYMLVVVNFGNASLKNDFTLSSYAEDTIEIKEEKIALKLAIERAEHNSPNDVIVSKIANANVSQVGKSFLDDTRQVLHIGLEKKHKHDAFITVELMTVGEFPFIGL